MIHLEVSSTTTYPPQQQMIDCSARDDMPSAEDCVFMEEEAASSDKVPDFDPSLVGERKRKTQEGLATVFIQQKSKPLSIPVAKSLAQSGYPLQPLLPDQTMAREETMMREHEMLEQNKTPKVEKSSAESASKNVSSKKTGSEIDSNSKLRLEDILYMGEVHRRIDITEKGEPLHVEKAQDKEGGNEAKKEEVVVEKQQPEKEEIEKEAEKKELDKEEKTAPEEEIIAPKKQKEASVDQKLPTGKFKSKKEKGGDKEGAKEEKGKEGGTSKEQAPLEAETVATPADGEKVPTKELDLSQKGQIAEPFISFIHASRPSAPSGVQDQKVHTVNSLENKLNDDLGFLVEEDYVEADVELKYVGKETGERQDEPEEEVVVGTDGDEPASLVVTDELKEAEESDEAVLEQNDFIEKAQVPPGKTDTTGMIQGGTDRAAITSPTEEQTGLDKSQVSDASSKDDALAEENSTKSESDERSEESRESHLED